MFSSVMKMFCLILVVAVSAQESLETLESKEEPKEEPKHYCGRALARARGYICFEMARQSQTNSASVFRPNSIAPRRFTNTPDKTGGIVDECCLKPCHISDILSYC